MAINLRDIRDAVIAYIDHIVTGLSAPVPAAGGEINPGEEFTFSATVLNITFSGLFPIPGPIRLKNVRYHLKVENPTVAQLKVPNATTATARSGPTTAYPVLAPGTFVGEMYLFFTAGSDYDVLDPGETDTLAGLKGKAGPGVAGGTTNIRFRILAEVDTDFLFPKNQDSPTATRSLVVHG
jgi:hypothetical protein